MSKKAIRVFSREFKLKIVRRMLAGESAGAAERKRGIQERTTRCVRPGSASDARGGAARNAERLSEKSRRRREKIPKNLRRRRFAL